MAVAPPIFPLSLAVRASSVDTQHRLPYYPHRTYPKKSQPLTSPSTSTSLTTLPKNPPKISISDLLKRDISRNAPDEFGGSYLGYETWMPTAPKVDNPRSVFNPATLAYLGDCIYETLKIDEIAQGIERGPTQSEVAEPTSEIGGTPELQIPVSQAANSSLPGIPGPDPELQLRGPVTRLRAGRLQQYLQGVIRHQLELAELMKPRSPSPHVANILMSFEGDVTK